MILRQAQDEGRGAIDFVVAARNAGRDVMNDQARKIADERAHELEISPTADPATLHLCWSIRDCLKALPHLPIGSRQPAGEALKKLALALDIAAKCFSYAEGSALAFAAGAATARQADDNPPTDDPAFAEQASAGKPGTDEQPKKDVGTEKPPYWLDLQQHE